MKKALSILLVAVLLMLTFSGCTPKPTTTEEVKPAGDIVVGVIQDLSGPTSVWGNAVKNGAELAVEKINNAGGINGQMIKLVAYDSKLDPQEAINVYNRLTDQDKAVAVIGPPISNIGLSLAPVAEAKKVPVVGSFIDPRVTTKEDGTPQEFMFLMQPSSVQYGEIMASYALEKLNIKKVAILYDQSNAFSVSLIKPFIEYYEKNGGTIAIQEVYKKDDKDFKTQLNKIKQAGAEGLYIPNYVQDCVLTIQQADQVGLKVPFIGGLDFAPPFATLMNDAELADNIYFANNYSATEPQLKEAHDAYVAKYKEEPVNKTYLGYDKVLIIEDAIKRAGSIDPVAIKDALEQTKDLQGTTGMLTISPENHRPIGLSMVMYKIEKGEYKDLGRHVPESHK